MVAFCPGAGLSWSEAAQMAEGRNGNAGRDCSKARLFMGGILAKEWGDGQELRAIVAAGIH